MPTFRGDCALQKRPGVEACDFLQLVIVESRLGLRKNPQLKGSHENIPARSLGSRATCRGHMHCTPVIA